MQKCVIYHQCTKVNRSGISLNGVFDLSFFRIQKQQNTIGNDGLLITVTNGGKKRQLKYVFVYVFIVLNAAIVRCARVNLAVIHIELARSQQRIATQYNCWYCVSLAQYLKRFASMRVLGHLIQSFDGDHSIAFDLLLGAHAKW